MGYFAENYEENLRDMICTNESIITKSNIINNPDECIRKVKHIKDSDVSISESLGVVSMMTIAVSATSVAVAPNIIASSVFLTSLIASIIIGKLDTNKIKLESKDKKDAQKNI